MNNTLFQAKTNPKRKKCQWEDDWFYVLAEQLQATFNVKLIPEQGDAPSGGTSKAGSG